jgi:hypothetical protein
MEGEGGFGGRIELSGGSSIQFHKLYPLAAEQ